MPFLYDVDDPLMWWTPAAVGAGVGVQRAWQAWRGGAVQPTQWGEPLGAAGQRVGDMVTGTTRLPASANSSRNDMP